MTKIDEIVSSIDNSEEESIFELSTHIKVKDGSDIHVKDVQHLLQNHGRAIIKSIYEQLN